SLQDQNTPLSISSSTLGIKELPTETIFEILYRCHNPTFLAVALCQMDLLKSFQKTPSTQPTPPQPQQSIHIERWKLQRIGDPLPVIQCFCGHLGFDPRVPPCFLDCVPCKYFTHVKQCNVTVEPGHVFKA
ncbi:hypothetical protein HDU76_008686, partial [Blyttiomyces sp. JEL0837]